MPLILPGNVATALGGAYEVANSVRFNDDDNPKMVVTPSSSGTNAGKIYTLSAWVKFGNIGVDKTIWSCSSDTYIYISGAGVITCNFRRNGSTNYEYGSSKKLKDPTAWYHIVLRVDTTDSTDADKVQVYVNGVEDTPATTTYQNMADDYETGANVSGVEQRIGVYSDGSLDFDGYMCEVMMVDNQSLAPTEFGEYDGDSPTIWKPKDISGISVGTNGYYLDFEDSSNLGNNAAGSGSADLTESNLAATDQSTDTCTNNFCTLNPLYNQYVDPTYSEGNLKITAGSGWAGAKATMGVSAGKWYWELKLSGTMSSHQHGVQQENVNEGAQNPQNTTGSTSFYNHDGGEVNTDGSNTSADYGTLDDGDTLGIALNMDGGSYGQITFYDNGNAIASNINLSSSSTTVMPHFSIDNSTVECNFGSPPYAISSGNADGNGYGNFEYSVPSGYYSLCTKNLAEYGG